MMGPNGLRFATAPFPVYRRPAWVLGLMLMTAALLLPRTTAAGLDSKLIERISAATYEVVVLKPTQDPLSYERPLPLELLPYTIRNDSYYSIGTAFAVGGGRLVTAAHVLELGHDSQYKTLRLRDRQGNVHDIDQIVRYSIDRDFVVFTLKGATSAVELPVNTRPRLNDNVLAVGNALGEGIVVRDGLYTSDTPEAQAGAWKWIRFSAAASPGNSGGPLLDSAGNVIGVVLRKSENENLNYALPISEALEGTGQVADIDLQLMYVIDNMDMSHTARMRKQIKLPKPIAALDSELRSIFRAFEDELQRDYFAKHRDRIFPAGSGSLQLLHSSYDAVMPGIISRREDGVWDAYFPENTSTGELGNNGRLAYGRLRGSLMVLLRRPDNVPLNRLYSDSKAHMDLVLQGLALARAVGVERVKITSLGKARQDEIFTDRYQRRWIVRSWDLPHSNEVVTSLSLPVPGGLVSMMRMTPTARAHAQLSDLRALADFVYVSYYGTLEQWKEFLALERLLPPVFGTVTLDFDYGKRFRYASRRLAFSYGQEQMNISASSDLTLRFGYFLENGKATWDVADVVAGENKDTGTFFFVSRKPRPPRELNDSFKTKWDNVAQRRHPYNRSAFFDDKRTLIGDVFTRDLDRERLESAPLLYTAFYGTEGNVATEQIANKLERFMKDMSVQER